MSEKTTVNVGPGAFTLLGVAFVALKLSGHIDWSWWLVTLPFWIGPGIVLGIIAVIVSAVAIAAVLAAVVGGFLWVADRIYEWGRS